MPNLGLQLSRTSSVVPSGGISIPPFSPTDLGGLFEWFSADEGVLNSINPDVPAVPASGTFNPPETETVVTRWVNRVSSGVNANQTTLNFQPVLFEDINLFRYLRFSGDALSLVYPTSINPPLSYYFVGNLATGATTYLINRATSTLSARNTMEQSGGTLRLRASTLVNSGLNVAFSDFYVGCGVLNGDGTGVVGVAPDGSVYNEASVSGLGTSTATATTNILGAATSSGGNSNSNIAEFLAYNQAHNEADRLKVVNYLRGKYLI